ncbi:MAG: hypothetical protein AB7O43_02155 [Hyphomicrobiaceae bacterium]
MLGPTLILLFGLSQAARDVYLGSVFQGVGVFAVILLAFSISTVVFGALTLLRRPGDLSKLAKHWKVSAAMVVTTAMSWPFYFHALTYLDPSIVNTIHSGMAPLTAMALALSGSRLTGPATAGAAERSCLIAIAGVILALWWLVLSGQSGVRNAGLLMQLTGLGAVFVSGSMITVSLLYSKRLHDLGAGAEAVTSVRYLLLLAVAAVIEATRAAPPDHLNADNLPVLAIATTLLMVLPLFALQVGIDNTRPLTAHVLRALGPVFVFALEQVDSRITYSTPVLICIVVYSVFAVLASILQARKASPERRASRQA